MSNETNRGVSLEEGEILEVGECCMSVIGQISVNCRNSIFGSLT